MAARRLLWAEAEGRSFKANSEKEKEGGWRCEGPFLTPKILCYSSPSWGCKEVIWKDIPMSPHSTLLELALHREAEFNSSLQHPSPSEMPLKTSSQHNLFSLMALQRLSLCCGLWSGFCCWYSRAEGGHTKRQKWQSWHNHHMQLVLLVQEVLPALLWPREAVWRLYN